MKISLGTVQFGMNYGITNSVGKPSFNEIGTILNLAKNQDIMQLDTAPSYGNAEQILGTLDVKDFSIYTKTPHFENEEIGNEDIEKLLNVFNKTLLDLKVSMVEGLLIHNVNDCYKKNNYLLFDTMLQLKQENKVKKIGVSVYEPKDIEFILENKLPIDMIQMPMNILDQRMLQSDVIQRLKSKNIEIHVRSVFLQGILLGDETIIPKRAYQHVQQYFSDLTKYNLTKLQAALLFIQQINDIDYVLLGVNSISNFKEIIEALEKLKTWEQTIDFSKYACEEISIIDPRKW